MSNKLNIIKSFIVIIVILFVFLLLLYRPTRYIIAYHVLGWRYSYTPKVEHREEPALEVIDSIAEPRGSFLVVTGIIENKSDKTCYEVLMKADFYDTQGNYLDNTKSYLDDYSFEPGQKQSFSLSVVNRNDLETFDYKLFASGCR